jgi:O-antigen ligase
MLIKKNTLLCDLAKFQLFIMLVYEGWYLEKYQAIPWFLQILALTIIGTTFLLILNDKNSAKNKVINYWVVFGFYSFIIAFGINARLSIITDSLFTFFSFIAVVFCAGVVSEYTKDYSWFSKAILFVCMLCAFFALLFGAPYKNDEYIVTTMSEFNNPNTLGLMMSIGTFMAVFPERQPRSFEWTIRIALLFAFLTVTINTGSRSSLLCELAIIALFVYSKLKLVKGRANTRLIKTLALIIVPTIAAVVIFNLVSSGNVAGSAINRLFEKFNSDSFGGRTDLYDAAWKLYKEHPLFGIGYNCFASVSGHGFFTHSTYMELLACTGTVGFVLFLTPVFIGTWNGIRAFKRDNGRSATILIMMLISGFFGIVYYHMVFLMVLYMEISRIPKKEKLV